MTDTSGDSSSGSWRVWGACLLIGCALLCAPLASAANEPTAPSDEQLRQLLAERVEKQKWATGIVGGVTGPQGRRVISYGTMSTTDTRPVDGRTAFEIASVTKVFTALLLADLAHEGVVGLDDPVVKCLPKRVTIPARNGRQITFTDLATYTSGLPLRPTNLHSQTSLDKYAGYTAAQMYAALSSYTLEYNAGTRFRYSNWGFGLLGHALERCAHRDYFDLVRQRITGPLRMRDTTAFPSASLKRRLAAGHDGGLRPVPNEGHGVLDPAGSLYSTVEDLMTLLEVFTGARKSKLDGVVKSMLAVRRATDDPDTQMALGWRVTTEGQRRIVWSNGRADGYRAYLAFDPDTRVGVVALANAATNAGVDDIARHILNPHFQPLKAHPRIQLAAEVIDRYVGRYRFDDGVVMTITRDGQRVIGDITAQGQQRALRRRRARVLSGRRRRPDPVR